MFSDAFKTIRESGYGVLCKSPEGAGDLKFSYGTALMIAKRVCVTVAHILHVDGNRPKSRHKKIEVIRLPQKLIQ